MSKKNIVTVLIILCIFLGQGEEKIKNIKGDIRVHRTTKDFCDVSEFTDLDYYLFCNTRLHKNITDWENTPIIIDKETKTVEDAKELYHKFEAMLPLSADEKEETYVEYVSPDCKWIVTTWWKFFHQTTELERKQILFYKKVKVKETVERREWFGENSYIIIKNEDSYEEITQQHYNKIKEIDDKSYGDLLLNEKGTLVAGIKDYEQLIIRDIEKETMLWSFSLQEIQDEVKKIRDDVQDGYKPYTKVIQFMGNESEGRIIIQCGRSSFFEVAYPSGEIKYLGEYLYSLCYSPDGKYAAYSDVDYDNGVDMKPEEQEKMAPGIYILEVKTGKIAYIYWDPLRDSNEGYMETRSFSWIEKDAFDEYTGNDK